MCSKEGRKNMKKKIIIALIIIIAIIAATAIIVNKIKIENRKYKIAQIKENKYLI